MENTIKIIGISGGTGSGKTFLTNQIKEKFGGNDFEIIELDAYYKDLSHIPFNKREKNNFDHPDSFDFNLLIRHLEELEEKNKVNIPIYDYKTHTRMKKNKLIHKKKLLVIEGIFSFLDQTLRSKMTYKVFINIAERIRLKRRLRRDMIDRNRTIESIKNQYKNSVVPMHEKFIQPLKQYADLIIEKESFDMSKKILFNNIERILND